MIFFRLIKFLFTCLLFFGLLRPVSNAQNHSIKPPIITILVDRVPRIPPTLENKQAHLLDYEGRKIIPLIESNYYRVNAFKPNETLILEPSFPRSFAENVPTLIFKQISDELTRLLLFKRGDGDVLFNSIQLTKLEWIKNHDPHSTVYAQTGTHLTYLGLLHLPLKTKIKIASLLTPAIWAKQKWLGWVDEFPFPIKEILKNQPTEEPQQKPTSLTFLTTAAREGLETALTIRELLQKANFKVDIKTLDSARFFQEVKKGNTQLFLNRWMRSSNQEPILDLLSTQGLRNLFQYSNPSLDLYFKKNPRATWDDTLPWVTQDLPFIPLFTWKHGLIIKNNLKWKNGNQPTLDDSFRFLLHLEVN